MQQKTARNATIKRSLGDIGEQEDDSGRIVPILDVAKFPNLLTSNTY